eukprot:scaffold10610_cov57-Phaeocystis_antarctica.AAC.1
MHASSVGTFASAAKFLADESVHPITRGMHPSSFTAAIDWVLAAVVVGIGVSDIAWRDAVGAAQFSGNATRITQHVGDRVEVHRRRVGAPVDGVSAVAVICVRIHQIVGRPGVGAARNGIDTLRIA